MTAPVGAAVPVQDAVYAALVADATFATWLGALPDDPRVYEVLAPAGTSLFDDTALTVPRPYVTLTGGQEVSFAAFCEPGFDVALTVRVWVPGARERLAKLGAGHVRRILDGATLPLDGHLALGVFVEGVRPQTDPDGGATQAMVDLRVFAQEIP
jgi:hypothetical protein